MYVLQVYTPQPIRYDSPVYTYFVLIGCNIIEYKKALYLKKKSFRLPRSMKRIFSSATNKIVFVNILLKTKLHSRVFYFNLSFDANTNSGDPLL